MTPFNRSFYFFLTMILFSLPILGNAQCGDSSNTYSFTYDGNAYDVVKTQNSWGDAAACAVQNGGHLVHINDQAEQDTLYQRIVNQAGVNPSYTSVSDGGNIAYIWIGANDLANEGEWIWDGDGDSSGTQFWQGQGSAGNGGGSAVNNEFYYWGGSSSGSPNEPDNFNGDQDAAGIALDSWPFGTASEWNDINASNTLYYVIEYENASSDRTLKGKEEDRELELLPNPVQQRLHIADIKKGPSYRILDLTGRVLEQGKLEGGSLNVSELDAGTYILQVRPQDGPQSSGRFIKAP